MDLVYMPEVLSYGSLRAPIYRDYEQPWNRDYFNYGNRSCGTSRYQQEQYHQQLQKSKAEKKEHCYLCKENKRRTLSSYIRGKNRTTSCSEIHEEEEEEQEEKIIDGNDKNNVINKKENKTE